MNDLWDFLTGPKLNYWLTWTGIYVSLAFFVFLALFMLYLEPRLPVERGFTWVIAAVAAVLIRSIAVRFYHRPIDIWGSLTWLNLLASILYTTKAMVQDKMIKRRAAGLRLFHSPWYTRRKKGD